MNNKISKEQKEQFFIQQIDDELYEKIYEKSYKETCEVPLHDLNYLHVLHKGFDGETKEGEIICHKAIAQTLLQIFKELYDASYPIEKIQLVDEYDADDETSMRANNSSCFNFRFISFTKIISKHGKGLAIDINPLYNPYIKYVNGKLNIEPATAEEYTDRTKNFPYKIDENDLCYKIFTKYGFEWGGSWESCKDYQHFELPDEAIENLNLQY